MENPLSKFQKANWPFTEIMSIFFNDGILYAATYRDGLNISTDYGLNWTRMGTFNPVFGITKIGNNLIAGSFPNGILISNDNGQNWKVVDTHGVFDHGNMISSFYEKDNNLYALTNCEVFVSTDAGINWTSIFDKKKAGYNDDQGFPMIFSMAKIYDDLFVGTATGVFSSKNNGSSWTYSSNGLQTSHNNYAYDILLTSLGLNLFACMGPNKGLFISSDFGANWKHIPFNNDSVYAISTMGNLLLAGTPQGIFISQDYGKNWVSFADGLDPKFRMIQKIFSYNNTLVVKTVLNDMGCIYTADIEQLIEAKDIKIEKIKLSGVVIFQNVSDKSMYFYKLITNPSSGYDYCKERTFVEIVSPGRFSQPVQIQPGLFLDARFYSSENCIDNDLLAECPVPYDAANGQVIQVTTSKKK